jgi:nucleoside-diphosphate-sugar epimerase
MSLHIQAAVTGASGFIGAEILKRLAPGGGVRALFRTEGDRSAYWRERGCRVVPGDLDDPQALARLVEGAGIVYHCAAAMGKGDPGLSHRVNVAGTENLLRAAIQAGVQRFVYLSSISVYAATRRPDNTITEEIEPEHTDQLNAYGNTKYGGELAVRKLAGASGLPFTIIRPTNVYGPGSGPWFAQFERMLRRLPVAIGAFPIDVVYVDDLVEAIVQAGASPLAANQVFHVGHEMVNMNRFILEVARVTGQRAWPLPGMVDRMLRRGIDRAYRLATGKHMSMCLTRPAFYPHAKAARAFGYAPSIPLAAGFTRLAAWYAGRATASLQGLPS